MLNGSPRSIRVGGVEATRPRAATELEGGSLTQSVAGAGAMVLAVLGLFGVLPGGLVSIAAIGAGFALLVGSAALAARYSRVLGESQRDVTGGLGFGALAGLAGLVLGLLVLLGVGGVDLLAVSAIVLGGALLFESGALARLESMVRQRRMANPGSPAEDAVYLSSGADVLVGAGVVVLGILALSGVSPLTLVLVAMLGIGCAVLLTGSSFAARIFNIFG